MFTPAEVANNVISIGKAKAGNKPYKLFLLGILAGMFIALAAVGANTASCTIANASVGKLVGACIFPVGLLMVLVAGSELFTGNNLIIVSVLTGDVKWGAMLKNWVIVYLGNFVGSMLVALLVVYAGQFNLFGGALAVTTISVATGKASLAFGPAILKGILCNFLVCIAVWISFAAKSVGGKLAGIYLPIMLFVLAGFEHSVANMYYVPAGLLAKMNPTALAAATDAGIAVDQLTWGNFFINNLIPVTIGNIIGGAVLVGVMYWAIYLADAKKEES